MYGGSLRIHMAGSMQSQPYAADRESISGLNFKTEDRILNQTQTPCAAGAYEGIHYLLLTV